MKLTRHYPRYDATLDTDGCSGRTNADLTLTMRMGFKQINPAGGADAGTYHDYGRSSAPSRNIVKWTARDWAAWKVNFCTSAQTFWDGKFWIDNRRGAFAIRQGRDVFIPNGFCRFRLIGSDAASGPQHHVIEVVRLAPTETWFGSHANLYDSRDTDLVAKGRDGAGNAIMQRAHVHEVGHLLGLGHVAIGQPGCPPSGDTNISACYGVTDADKNSVMGGGMRRDTVHGKAWNDAFEAFVRAQPHSSIYTPPPAKSRPTTVVMNRIYPRSVAEFEASAVLTTPVRGR